MQTSSVSNLRNFHQRHLTNSSSVNILNPDQTIASQNISHELNEDSEKQEQIDINTKTKGKVFLPIVQIKWELIKGCPDL